MAYIHDDGSRGDMTDTLFPKPDSHVVTVDRVPDWLSSGDPIVQRGSKLVAVSLTQTEPRWRRLLACLPTWLRTWRGRT